MKKLFFLLAIALVSINSTFAQVDFSTLVSARDRYVFPIGIHAYASPVIQAEVDAVWVNPSVNPIKLQSVGYIGWGSYGIKSGTIHEVDHIVFANFGLPKKLNLSVQMMAWVYPDEVLAFTPGQPDLVSQISLSRDFPINGNALFTPKFTWLEIYKYGEMKTGAGFLGEMTYVFPQLFKFSTPSLYVQTFYSNGFYMLNKGFLEVRGGGEIAFDLKVGTLKLDLKYQQNLQKDYSELFYTGFFGGITWVF